MERKIKIRDLRKKEKFVVDDVYLNGYAKLVCPYATLTYLSLCRHAGKEQKAFPSIDKMAEEFNVSRPSIIRGLKELENLKIIKKNRIGKRLNNEYFLLDKSEWVVKSEVNNIDFIAKSEVNNRYQVKSIIDTSEVNDVDCKETQYKETHKKDIAVADAPAAFFKKIQSYFTSQYEKRFGSKPAINFGKDNKVVAKARQLFKAEAEWQQLIDDFIVSRKGKELSYTLAICFSADTLNKWKAGNLSLDLDVIEQRKKEEAKRRLEIERRQKILANEEERKKAPEQAKKDRAALEKLREKMRTMSIVKSMS